MKANKTMREMMVAASLIAVSACGAVEPQDTAMVSPDDAGAGSGSGSGSGSGLGSGSGSGSGSDSMPTACTKASECGAGMMCDLATSACVTPSLDIDEAAFVVQGATVWTAVSNPVLHGTFSAPAGAGVQVVVGSGQGTIAALTGGAWSVQLPAGAITSSDTMIDVVMTDPSGGLVQLSRRFSLDTVGPNIALASTLVKDEREDTIDFSTGDAIHTHAGPAIDLAGGACPAVYKYAYLMDAQPLYGSSASPNPLAFSMTIADTQVQAGTQMFRVRTDANETLIDWRALPAPNAAGVYTVDLTRSGGANQIALLGTRTGKFYIDVRAKDWGNQESTKSFCWDHHPLPPPVEVQPMQPGELFGFKFIEEPVRAGLLINELGSFMVAEQRFVQHSAEPSTLSIQIGRGAVHYTKSTYTGYYDLLINNDYPCPAGSTAVECQTSFPKPSLAGYQSTSGTATPWFSILIIDETSGQTYDTGSPLQIFSLPARAIGAAPRAYRIVVRSPSVTELQPPQDGLSVEPYDVWLLDGLQYLGTQPDVRGTYCKRMNTTTHRCEGVVQVTAMSALDRASLVIDSITTTISQNGAPLSYIPANARTTPTMTWDSGDDDLPGSY